MLELTLIQKISVWALPLIFAVTLHEVAHGWVASWCGDQTARLSGRLSFNPIYHIDLIGTIIVPFLMLITTPFIFGWAKPVPVDPRNLLNRRRGMILVACAGPFANLMMAILWGFMEKIGILLMSSHDWPAFSIPIVYMGSAGVMINVMLAAFNLLPLPLLDGGKIFSHLLSPRLAYYFDQIEPYSFLILMILLFSGLLPVLVQPLVSLLFYIVHTAVGITAW